MTRLIQEDVECNAARQLEMEAKRVAEEIERVEKAKLEKELKEGTAAKLREHRRPQPSERVEYQVQRIGLDYNQPWPTDEEIGAILMNDPRAGGTVYCSHIEIRFAHLQMVPTPVLLSDAPVDAVQAELRAHNTFASRSTVSSTASLPSHGQADGTAEGIPPGGGKPTSRS